MIGDPHTFKLKPGAHAPPFALPATEGRTLSLADFKGKPALVVAFWCNHCPYVQAWEGRMIDLQKAYADKGAQFVLINSNDPAKYPTDDFAHMQQRAKEKGYPFPYLHDASQEVAKAYGALVTPHVLVFDADLTLRYQGALDDNHESPSAVTHALLRDALDAVLAGKSPATSEAPVRGCSVKWKA